MDEMILQKLIQMTHVSIWLIWGANDGLFSLIARKEIFQQTKIVQKSFFKT